MSRVSLDTYEHKPGDAFKSLPEIYQIELTNHCNLKCPMCLRTTDMVRNKSFIDIQLIEQMYWRGDFGGSYYVELQMAGEPTLHPDLGKIIKFLQETVGVLVGLSTHGLTMHRKGVCDALVRLDALTISVDSLDPDTYHRLRHPAHVSDLIGGLHFLHDRIQFMKIAYEKYRPPFIELQLIDTPLAGGPPPVEQLENLIKANRWQDLYHVRTVGDSFAEMQGRESGRKPNMPVCLNPFSSVSVTATGDVVSCCYVFDPDERTVNYYGNLNQQSLAEIWNGETVKKMRELQMQGTQIDQCAKCYHRSPTQIHQTIVARLVQHQKRSK